jgi:uncharacterized protein
MLSDSNVWLALALLQHEFHAAARKWLSGLSAHERVFFCRSTQQSFLRLLTTRAVLAPYGIPPLSNEAAWHAFEGFLKNRSINFMEEPSGLEAHWKRLTNGLKPAPKLWMDAYLAAFAMAGEYSLVTLDKAFKQFKGLDLVVLE